MTVDTNSEDRSNRRPGHRLGERNPQTLPCDRAGWETHDENRRNTARWRAVLAWAGTPGGKYVA